MRYAELLRESGFTGNKPVNTEANRTAVRAATERYIAEHGPRFVDDLGDSLRRGFEVEFNERRFLLDYDFLRQGTLGIAGIHEAVGRMYPDMTRLVEAPVREPSSTVEIMGNGCGNDIVYATEKQLREWLARHTRKNLVVEVEFSRWHLNP